MAPERDPRRDPPRTQSGRVSSPTRAGPEGRAVVDVHNYIPYLLSSVNNTLSRGASKLYLDRFGVGIVEWRLLSMLAIEPGIPAARACEVLGNDRAAVSRALGGLERKGLVAGVANHPGDPRRRDWRLTEEGGALHDTILAIALDREARLIAGVAARDLEIFLRVMRQMHKNVLTLDPGDPRDTDPEEG